MAEEEKKAEEKKTEEAKKPAEAEKKEKKGEEKAEKKAEEPPPPPPPPEIVLRVYMHCEGCARKVRRRLKGFEGVEDVITDCKASKVVVKGEKADPLKVLERVQRKSHRQVQLLSPIPKPPAEDAKKPEEKENKPEEKKPEPPPLITVVLKVHMHCEACAQEIKRRIQRMEGVESADPDLKSSQVAVKGVFDPPKLVEYVYKRTGKHAVIVKQEPEKKEEEKAKDAKEEKKAGEAGKENKGEGEAKENKESGEPKVTGGEEASPVVDLKKSDNYYSVPSIYVPHSYYAGEYPPQTYPPPASPPYTYPPYTYPPQIPSHPYPPQIFSDENPNACSVM